MSASSTRWRQATGPPPETQQHIRQRENQKVNKYKVHSNIHNLHFIPAVMDTYGMFGEGTKKLISELKELQKQGMQRGDVATQLQQSIAVQLHKATPSH